MTDKSKLILDLTKAYNDNRCSDYKESLKAVLDMLESAEGEYIKKEDALFKKWQFKFKDVDGERWFVNVKDIESLPTYSFPKNGRRFSCPNCGFKADWYIPDREKGELTDEEVISYCNKHGYVICSQAVIDDPERERYRIRFAGYVGVDGEEVKPMSKLLIGLSARSGKFGVIPDPPEPEETECNGDYQEGFCDDCDQFEQCLIAWRDDEE